MVGLAANRLFVRSEVPMSRDKADCCFRCRLYTAPASGFCKVACVTVDFAHSFTIDSCSELLSQYCPVLSTLSVDSCKSNMRSLRELVSELTPWVHCDPFSMFQTS